MILRSVDQKRRNSCSAKDRVIVWKLSELVVDLKLKFHVSHLSFKFGFRRTASRFKLRAVLPFDNDHVLSILISSAARYDSFWQVNALADALVQDSLFLVFKERLKVFGIRVAVDNRKDVFLFNNIARRVVACIHVQICYRLKQLKSAAFSLA